MVGGAISRPVACSFLVLTRRTRRQTYALRAWGRARSATRRFLFGQRVQHVEGVYHRSAPHFLAPDVAEMVLLMRELALARGGGDVHETDRLGARAAAGAGNARDRYGEIDSGMRDRALGHRFRRRAAHRAVFLQD